MRTVSELLKNFDWKQIPGCQGRFTMAEPPAEGVPFTSLMGEDCELVEIDSVLAADKILIVPLEDGGVISYRRPNGNCVHTLNTPEGFFRKLRDLRIDPKTLSPMS